MLNTEDSYRADVADPSNPKLITIEGTMELCQELEIDPESVSIAHLPDRYC